MTTLSEYISESILSSTRTGKTGIDYEMRQYGLDPSKATVNADGTIDYDGTVLLQSKGLTKLPFKFNKVNGDFDCCDNRLTSLDGCPNTVYGYFDCSTNKLVNLKGCPAQVGRHFLCSKNNITTLKGAPDTVKGNFRCYRNNLTNLEGGPEQVGNDYVCSNNQLTSLDGIPKKLHFLYCHNNPGRFTKEDVLKVCKIKESNIRVQ
jgi:hypothetical protein